MHDEFAGYFQASVNVNATLTVKGALPFPCLVPDAIVCGLVDSVNVPGVQLAFGLPPPPGVALLHWNRMALNGTDEQFVKEVPAAFAVKVQLLLPPFMVHMIVAEVFPLTGVVSGSGELNVIVEGETVTLPVTANANFLKMILGNATAVPGHFDFQSAALQIVEKIKHAEMVNRTAMGAVPYAAEIVKVAVAV